MRKCFVLQCVAVEFLESVKLIIYESWDWKRWKMIRKIQDIFLTLIFNLFMKQENYSYRLITVIFFYVLFIFNVKTQRDLILKVWIIFVFFLAKKSRAFSLFLFVHRCSSPWSSLFCVSLLIKTNFPCFSSVFKYNLTSKNICGSIHVFLRCKGRFWWIGGSKGCKLCIFLAE